MAKYSLSPRMKAAVGSANVKNNELNNYLAVEKARDAEESNPPQSSKKAGFFEKGTATAIDLFGNIFTGAAKGIEGIFDAGAGVVGAVGGIFDKGFQEDVKRVVEYDATNEWLGKPFDELTKESFTNESEIGRIVESVFSGVGQMLPTVAVSLIPGVGQAGALATMGVSAAGSGTEEAFKDGADYYKGLGYGAVSGATEVATEKLFGGLTKGITGKGVLDFGKDVAEQGAKRFIKGAVEEGLEEVASEAVNPLTKAIYKGKDALKEYANPEYYKGLGEAFAVGAGTGMVYGGTVGKAINKARGISEDISASVEANESIAKKLTKAQDNGTLTEAAERSAASAELQNLKNIEAKLKGAKESDRAQFIRSYRLSDTFNQDGSLKPEVLADKRARAEGVEFIAEGENGESTAQNAFDKRYYSTTLRGKEQTIRNDLAEMSSEDEKIRVFSGELSEKAKANFTKMKKALTSLNEHRGESVSYVIVEPNSKFNGAERRGDTIYIAADTFERDASTAYLDEASRSGNFAGTLMHEYGHTTEGTAAHAALDNFLAEDVELYTSSVDRVLGQNYGINAEDIQQITEKRKAGGELTREEQQKLKTFRSEVGATMSEQLLGNERVIEKLVREGDPLVDRVISWAESVKNTLAGKGDKYTLAERRRIDKALDLYLKASEAAGKMDLVKRIIALRKEDEEPVTPTDGSNTAENAENEAVNNQKSGDMGVSSNDNGIKYALRGVANDGKKIYESNFPLGTPKSAKSERILDFIRNVWSKKPIRLVVSNGEKTRTILAKFDPYFDETKTIASDASKLAGGNRHGTRSEQRVTLDLADDYYEIASEAKYNYSKLETGKESSTHQNVKMWHYFVNEIYFAEYGEKEYSPYTVTINVKEKHDGDFVYSFSAEKEFSTQRTLHAAVSTRKGTNGELFINSIPGSEEKVNIETKFSLKNIQLDALKKRGVVGDGLLDAVYLADEILSVNGEITDDAKAVLYHATSEENANKINATGKMYGKEDNLFFSTKSDGEILGYGNAVVRAEIPLEKLTLNDVFDKEVHLTMPVKPYQLTNIRFSYKAPAESKVYKRIAEWEKLKVYEKADAEKMLYTILSDVMTFSEDEAAVMTMESRKEAEKMLWSELNKALTEKEMKVAADKVADFLISRSVVKSWLVDPYEAHTIENAETVLSHLKTYLHNLNLTHIKGEIKHKYDTAAGGVMLMWGTKKSGYGVDQIISELNSQVNGYGFPVDTNANEADLFFAIHEAYTKARRDLKQAYENYKDRALEKDERAALKKDIAEKILNTYKNSGRESTLAKATWLFKAELWKADQRVEYMKQYNVLISKVDAFRELTMGKFENANTYHPDLFTGSVEQLKKIVRGGLISIKSTRDAVGKLAQWYTADNPIVGEGNYDPDIRDKLAQIADRGLSDYAGKKVNAKELLEPFIHRIDLSGIRNELKEMYGEENRSILATWNAKPGMDAVTLADVAAALEKEGVSITGSEFELFTQIDQIYRDAVGPFTAEDLRNLADIVAYFTKFIKKFNKVWNGKKYVEAEPIAKKHVEIIRKNKFFKIGWFNNLLFGRYGKTFLRPETLARRMDLYEDGFYTHTLSEFRQGLIQANDYEYEMMKAVADFETENKGYFRDLAKRRIEFRGNQIPADIALSLYMTSKRQQAQAGLATSGFKYTVGDDTVNVQGYMPQKTPRGVEIGAERMQKLLWDEFSKEDKAFIKIAESLFNGRCKQLKHDTDMNTKGYSNTVDGYYYPIKRAFIAKSVDSDFEDLMGRASNKSFNKDTVKGAKGVLCIMPLTEVLGRHVRGVAQYASLATVVRNYDTLYNLDIGDNANDPTSIARESENVWQEGGDYFKKLLADMQGIGERQSAFLSVIRGNYATFQLGGNPKTWVTQLSSFFASTSVLNFDNVIKGFGIDGSDVDEYCTLAKLRNANNDAVLAQANANKPGLLTKRTKLGDASKRVSDALMAPIGAVDRLVIKKLFGACQVEVVERGGAKVGTKENKIEAGKLLEEVIIKTQQNSLATERSAAMRSSNELLKSLTMFSADGMNVFGQVVDSLGEVTVLKAKLRSATAAKEKAELESKLKEAGKRARKSVFALVSSAVFMAAIGLLFNWLYHRIDEEETTENIALDTTANFVGNMLGGLPVFRDIYSYFTDGYEVQNYMYSVLNDTLEAATSARDLSASAFTGSFDSRQAAQTVRKTIYAGGQLLGIPARNLYNVTYSILGFIPSVKYKWDDMFYKQAYSSDLKKAIEADDEDMIATITGIMTGERVGAIKSDKVREELNALTLKGYSALPRAIADSITVNGEKVNLTNTQKKKFKEIYSIANESVEQLVSLKQYGEADEKVRASAIKKIYDIYYQLAEDAILGTESSSKSVLFAEAIDIEKLAIIVATANSITADKDRNGNSISGSKKKKIERYIQSLKLTAAQKYMIMGYLGYTNANGEAQVKAYINRLKLTKEEKAELLKYSGYK